MCSLYRVVMSRPVCPTYTLLQVLHFILYTPAGLSFLVFRVSCLESYFYVGVLEHVGYLVNCWTMKLEFRPFTDLVGRFLLVCLHVNDRVVSSF